MNKILIGLAFTMLSLIPLRFSTPEKSSEITEDTTAIAEVVVPQVVDYLQIYEEMELEDVINKKAFEQAVEGIIKIDPENKDVITLIDYSKPSKEERLYVLDLKEKKILYSTHVLHGAKSGLEMPTSFSNEVNSHKSSLGFFLTENSYYGKYGYALRLNGLEKGINDKAKERAIVIHGSKFASPQVIKTAKRTPRSLGCPAIPYDVKDDIINVIKDGSLVYIYANNEEYVYKSDIVSGNSLFEDFA